jgi:hypothetical protein
VCLNIDDHAMSVLQMVGNDSRAQLDFLRQNDQQSRRSLGMIFHAIDNHFFKTLKNIFVPCCGTLYSVLS